MPCFAAHTLGCEDLRPDRMHLRVDRTQGDSVVCEAKRYMHSTISYVER